MVCEKY